MSTAARVPETRELTGDQAWNTLVATDRRKLLKDAFMRLRSADGFSHSRSLAFTTALLLIQAIVALVGLAAAFGDHGLGRVIVRTIHEAVPGPAGRVLTDAVEQAHRAGATDRWLAIAFGFVGALVTGATMLGQFERGLNRMYGIEQDRPTVQKYGLALLLTVTSGLLATAAFVALALGRGIEKGIDSETTTEVWSVVRWPLAVVFATAAFTMLFRWSPRRRQPSPSWLAFGAIVSVALWFVSTVLLELVFRSATSFGEAYGPLAGMVALLFWSFFSAVSILYGGAVAAQLEAVRAGRPRPKDKKKVRQSEPDLPPRLVPSQS
jgi:YihY family inner membrane protein